MIAGLLVVISLFGILERSAGDDPGNAFTSALGGLFNVLRFPVHTLFPGLAESNAIVFCAGFLVNCLLYGLIYERIHTAVKMRRRKDDDSRGSEASA